MARVWLWFLDMYCQEEAGILPYCALAAILLCKTGKSKLFRSFVLVFDIYIDRGYLGILVSSPTFLSG